MDKKDFPELFDESQQQETSDLELLRTRKEVVELKAKLQKYEQILKDNDLMDGVEPVVSDVEQICVRKFNVTMNCPRKVQDLRWKTIRFWTCYTRIYCWHEEKL